MHEHHVTMRARTGELGPLIWLCGTCHTEIHAIANARVAKLRGGKSTVVTEWTHQRHPHEIQLAEKVIGALVRILLTTDNSDLPKVTSLELPTALNNGIVLLKKQLGLRNKKEVILYCVANVLKRAGFLKE